MEYFAAVQEGRIRVKAAQEVLQEVVGPSHPMLLLKLGITDWTPVGEEMMHKLLPGKDNSAAIVICDADGNSKAMSLWISETKALECARSLELKGVPEFPGEVKLPI